jgi:hypothetical protein
VGATLVFYHASPRLRAGRDLNIDCPVAVTDMDDTLEQPEPSSILNGSTMDEDGEQESSGDEDGGLDWTKLPCVHLPLD